VTDELRGEGREGWYLQDPIFRKTEGYEKWLGLVYSMGEVDKLVKELGHRPLLSGAFTWTATWLQ
jgi:hypothetical protein